VPVYVEEQLGGGGIAVGFAVGSLFLAAVLVRPLAGRLGDRVGRRRSGASAIDRAGEPV